jgi:putative PIN family toxin of toxin-antitoxin system
VVSRSESSQRYCVLMSDIRVILDTNVLISRLLIPASTAGHAVRRLLDRTQPLVSDDTLSELATTLSRSKFDPYVSREDRQTFFELFARVAEWVTVTSTIRACRDPKDNKFLELAVDGKADWIVTGDKDLLQLGTFQETKIMTPAAVLALPESALP